MATPKPATPIRNQRTESPVTGLCYDRQFWLGGLVIVAVTFLAYQSMWHAGYIWDDDDHLTANPVMTLTRGLQMIWSSLTYSRYYPLTLTSFWFEHRLWGFNPAPYHFVNIALHALNGILLYQLLRRLMIPAPWFAAMLWVLHPVNVESVAWITEQKNTLSGLFFFLTLLSYLQFETGGKKRWYALAVLCAAAAMLSKPSTVVLPAVLLLIVWWRRGRWQLTDIVRSAPFLALAIGMSVVAIVEQHGNVLRARASEWNLTTPERLLIAGKAIWFYAASVLWPGGLTFVYPRWVLQPGSILSWIPLGVLLAMGAFLWRRRQVAWVRAALFGLGFYVIALLPVLGFFEVFYFRFSFVADHFQYLASAGLIALVSSGVAWTCKRAKRPREPTVVVAAFIALLVLGTLTSGQAAIYHDVETLWRDTLAKNPRCWMASNNLGVFLFESGRTQEAMEEYQHALQIWPNYPEAHKNLGDALVRLGAVPQAIGQYEQALQIKPNYVEAHNNLGSVLLQLGRTQDAIAHFEEALRVDPNHANTHGSLGNALLQLGRIQEAIVQYEYVVRLKPTDAGTHVQLGNAYQQLGKTRDAITEYEQAVRLNPNLVQAQNNLAWVLATTPPLDGGDPARAVALAQRACELTGYRVADTINTLAVSLAAAGRSNDAIAAAEQALTLARTAGQIQLGGQIEGELKQYRAGSAR